MNIPSKLLEVIFDYKGQVSFGRVGGLLCLAFSMLMALAGLKYGSDDKKLAYCSTISLQFLGAAVSLYLPSKASETFSKKWAPGISDTVVAPTTPPAPPAPPAPAEVKPMDAVKTVVKETVKLVEDVASGKATDD